MCDGAAIVKAAAAADDDDGEGACSAALRRFAGGGWQSPSRPACVVFVSASATASVPVCRLPPVHVLGRL